MDHLLGFGFNMTALFVPYGVARCSANGGIVGPQDRSSVCASPQEPPAAAGIIHGTLTANLLGSLHSLLIAPGPIERTSWPTRLMLSLGAGLYEELFFRVLLVTGLAAAGRVALGLGTRGAGILAATL